MNLEKNRPAPLQLDGISGKRKYQLFSNLLDLSFNLSGDAHFLSDFSVWAGEEARGGVIRVGAFGPAGRLAGCAAARTATCYASNGKIKLGIIGAVATDPLYRGRGVASDAVSFLLKWLESQDVAMTVLWGSDVGFYARFGFRPFGAQLMLGLKDYLETSHPQQARDVGKPSGIVKQGWVDGIFNKMLQRRTGLKHELCDIEWIREHRHVEWFWMGSPEQPDAYVGYGRGIDLQGLVHEWGGDPGALRTLLSRVGELYPNAKILGSPELLGRPRMGAQTLGLALIHQPEVILKAYGLPKERLPEAPLETLKDPRTIFGDERNPGLPLWFWGLDSA